MTFGSDAQIGIPAPEVPFSISNKQSVKKASCFAADTLTFFAES